jgi:hypothetical protein
MALHGASLAFFGLLDNITGSCGIISLETEMDDHGDVDLVASLGAYGTVGIYTTFDVVNVEATVNGEQLGKGCYKYDDILEIMLEHTGSTQSTETIELRAHLKAVL